MKDRHRHSLPYSSSMRCVSEDEIPSNLLIITCLMISLGKTGSCLRACSTICQVVSNVARNLGIAITVRLGQHSCEEENIQKYIYILTKIGDYKKVLCYVRLLYVESIKQEIQMPRRVRSGVSVKSNGQHSPYKRGAIYRIFLQPPHSFN